jgi:hypothetical protein
MDILLERFWVVHHDTAPRAKKDAVLLALTLKTREPSQKYRWLVGCFQDKPELIIHHKTTPAEDYLKF